MSQNEARIHVQSSAPASTRTVTSIVSNAERALGYPSVPCVAALHACVEGVGCARGEGGLGDASVKGSNGGDEASW